MSELFFLTLGSVFLGCTVPVLITFLTSHHKIYEKQGSKLFKEFKKLFKQIKNSEDLIEDLPSFYWDHLHIFDYKENLLDLLKGFLALGSFFMVVSFLYENLIVKLGIFLVFLVAAFIILIIDRWLYSSIRNLIKLFRSR